MVAWLTSAGSRVPRGFGRGVVERVKAFETDWALFEVMKIKWLPCFGYFFRPKQRKCQNTA